MSLHKVNDSRHYNDHLQQFSLIEGLQKDYIEKNCKGIVGGCGHLPV